jgi:hypothetical protein
MEEGRNAGEDDLLASVTASLWMWPISCPEGTYFLPRDVKIRR